MKSVEYAHQQVRPANAEAERSVLGHFLIDNRYYDEALALGLSDADFSLDSHRRIFRAVQTVAEAGRVDLITITEELERRHELQSVGDVGYVSGLVDGVPDRANIKHHVRLVIEKSKLRKVLHSCEATMAGIADGLSSDAAISLLSEDLLQVQAGSDDAPAERVLRFSDGVYNDWQKLFNGDQDLIGLTTGLDCLDITTTGIRPGELWVVGGRTGDGKTSLGLQTAAANCRRNIPVGVFSVEMSKGDLLQRLWALEGGISYQDIRYPRRLSPEAVADVRAAMCTVAFASTPRPV